MDSIRLGVVFDGGGFAGAYSVGYIKAVHALGLRPIYAQGVSVGALTGAGYAEDNGDPCKAEKIWLKTEREGPHAVFPTLDIARRVFKSSLFANQGVSKLADTLDYPTLVSSPMRFDSVVYNETTRRQEIFSNHDQRCKENPFVLRQAIIASCSLNGFLEPVNIGRCTYSDGVSFLIKPAVQYGANTIFVFLNNAEDSPPPTGDKWWLYRLLAGIHAMNNILEEKEIDAAEGANQNLSAFEEIANVLNTASAAKRLLLGKTLRNLRFTFEGKRPVHVVVVRPARQIPTLWTLGFKPGDISKGIAHGYDAGMRTIEKFLSRSQ